MERPITLTLRGAISMCIYCGTSNYRKIYVSHFGPIPKDEQGRSYHIHHIDGNNKNNRLSNLKAVSLQEHYDIHRSQGDAYACLKLMRLLNLSEEERIQIIKINGEESRKRNLKRVANGTHQWLGERNPVHKKIADGTHNFLGGEISRKITAKRLADGTHNLLGPYQNRKRMEEGTHNFLKKEIREQIRLKHIENLRNGKGPFAEKVTCPHCGLVGQRANMCRHHFENCKLAPNPKERKKFKCEYCFKEVSIQNYVRFHADKCKHKPN